MGNDLHAERVGILLRLKLVGVIFDEICTPNQAENWATLLFQLMLHGVISPSRNMLEKKE